MMENDPDAQKYFLLQEQLELWNERVHDESLSRKEREYAENKYIEIAQKAINALKSFNDRWDEENGPLPEPDTEIVQKVQNKLANKGIEVTLDEIKDMLKDDI